MATYADSEPWKVQHGLAMASYLFEDGIAWGLSIYQKLNEEESRLQADILDGRRKFDEVEYSELEKSFRMWTKGSEFLAELTQGVIDRGYAVRGFDEFAKCLEEARAVLANRAM